MNYNFQIGQGLGNVNFNLSENKIFTLLGEPTSTEKTTGNKCYSYEYDYDNIGISIILNFDEFAEPKKSMHVHTENIIYHNKTWKGLNENNLLKIIKKIHQERKIKCDFEYEKIEYNEFTQKEYDFDNIGLTLWLKNDFFDGAVVYKYE